MYRKLKVREKSMENINTVPTFNKTSFGVFNMGFLLLSFLFLCVAQPQTHDNLSASASGGLGL